MSGAAAFAAPDAPATGRLERMHEFFVTRRHRWDSLAPLLWQATGNGPAPWEEMAPSWEGPVPSLFVPAGGGLACTFQVPPGALFRVRARVAGTNGGPARLRVSIRTVDEGPEVRAEWRLRHRGPRGGWKPLFRGLSRFAGRRVELVLHGPVAAGDPAGAAAVWADPSLAFAIPRRELAVLTRAYLRQFGIGRMRARAAARRAAAAAPPPLSEPAGNPAADAGPPLVSFLVAVAADAGPAALEATLASLRAQTLGRWEALLLADAAALAPGDEARVRVLRVEGSIAAMLNRGLHEAAAPFVAVVDAGDRLDPAAVHALAERAAAVPGAVLIYTDEDRLGAAGTRQPAFRKPAWSPEYLRSFFYIRRLCAVSAAAARAAGGWRAEAEGAHEYDLVLRVTEGGGPVEHVAQVLYHGAARPMLRWEWLARGAEPRAAARVLEAHLARAVPGAVREDGCAPGLHCVRYPVHGTPLVSIVIPTAGFTREVGGRRLDLLANCLDTVVHRTDYPRYEVVCVDNGDLRPETRAAVDALPGGRVRFVTYTGLFNVADKMNLGAAEARGEHLLFLNDDTEVRSEGWIGWLLGLSQLRGVGAVGAKLYFPGGRVQHAGAFMHRGAADHVYRGVLPEHPGDGFDLLAVRDYSAVTGACMMTRRDVFDAAGGFDTEFPVNFNDVDYCMKVRQHGYRVVFTPYARLFHLESVSRTVIEEPEAVRRLRDRWGAGDDPFFTGGHG